ncbi:MAG: helix-turn-helix transcriptional regulator [Clostridia bacterium]|nr:helix-turn-helix transcriptional regulator [Clostridia bacterium]
MEITARLKALLREREWTVARLAKESGLPESTIRSLMSRNAEPTLKTLEAICAGMRITPEQFFNNTSDIGLREEERRLLFQWACLRESDKELVYALIESLSEKG